MNARAKDLMVGSGDAAADGVPEFDALLRNAPAAPHAMTHPVYVVIGRIVALDAAGQPVVEWSGAPAPIAARVAVPLSAARLKSAVDSRQDVVLLFENGDTAQPIITGLIQTPDTVEEVRVIEADVDGKRVRLVAQDEIVFQCGSASITLRRNGRVIVQGTYVETRSEGTNRIKGGQVRIN